MRRINKRPFLGARGRLLRAGPVIYGRGDDSRGTTCRAEPGSDPGRALLHTRPAGRATKAWLFRNVPEKKKFKKKRNSLKAKRKSGQGSGAGSSSRVPRGGFP